MALPVSIGDAILLSQLALRLGKILTSGRKSAPAEFREIQNQLYTLSNSLEFVASCTRQSSDNGQVTEATDARDQQEPILSRMISNCASTLKHLESVLDKYSIIGQNFEAADDDEPRPWRGRIKENWKKIRWTTEGGDLDRLRDTLAIHITGLNLAVSAINKSATNSLQDARTP